MKNEFTQQTKKLASIELNQLIEEAAQDIYADKVESIHSIIETRLTETRALALKLYLSMPEDKRFPGDLPHNKAIKTVMELYPKKEDRTTAYKYINMSRRVVLLNSVVTSKIKLRNVAMKTLQGLIRAEVTNSTKGSKVTISQLINSCPLKVSAIAFKNGTTAPLTDTEHEDIFIQEEIRLQFISDLCELNLVDMSLSDHTHMVEVPSHLAARVDSPTWHRMHELAQLVSTKTISLEPLRLDPKNMITRSSWYYRTPELSADQVEFIQYQLHLKYQFKADALDRVADCYMEHLKSDDGTLPINWESWVPAKIEFFKEQIRASQANGGHYIDAKFDSALRWYMQSEIGHFQTSKALRSLVQVADIKNPVKKDFKNNVIQMYSILTKTKDMGKYVALVEESMRQEDLRLQIAKSMNIALETDVFNKDNIKPLFMVWAYNAGKNRILDGVTVSEAQLFGDTIENVKVEGLIAITGAKNDEKNRDILWSAFESTVKELVPMVVILKQLFKNIIKHNPLTQTEWTLPDGAIAQYASVESKSETLFFVDSNGKQHQHLHHKKMISENVKSSGLLPRVIHSVDAWVARQLVIRAARLGIAIVPNHDSFMFDEQYEDVVDQLVQEIFIELLESDCLSNIIKNLNTSCKSLAIRNANRDIITDEDLFEKYGRLTVADLLVSEPMDLEDI